MTLSPDRLAEIARAVTERRPDDPQFERNRGMLGELCDELSVAGGIIATWADREIQKNGFTSNASRLEDLRHARSYGERLVKTTTSGLRR